MTKTPLDIEPAFAELNLPPQDLTELEFCQSNKPAKVLAWVNSLPATRANHTSVLLYQALPQIARLDIAPAKRLEMLEHLRPAVQQCIMSLAKEFLNQPIILPEGPLKTAIVAQALQKNMCNSYTISALQLLRSDKPDPTLLASALHRSITGLGLILLRGYQLYTQVPALLWLHLHSLMDAARAAGLSNTPVADPLLVHSRGCTIEQAYNRVLLLACSNPNQIRQSDISVLYQALEVWAPFCTLRPAEGSDQLFMVNLQQDRPPMYLKRYGSTLNEACLALDTFNLQQQFAKRQSGEKYDHPAFDQHMSKMLLNHSEEALRSEKRRRDERQTSSGDFEVCVGLSVIHEQLAGGISFKQFLADGGQKSLNLDYDAFMSKPLSAEHDPWADAFDATPEHGNRSYGSKNADNNTATAHVPLYKVIAQDRSPGGYCVRWKDQVPLLVKAGELIAMRQPGRRSWQLAAIRWISQQRGSTLLGLQLLASNAIPIAISMTHKTGGESDYMRGLRLPEQTLPKQVESVITPTLPFHEKAKVRILKSSQTTKAQLTKCLFSTGSISQFTLRTLETTEPANQKATPEEFKSSW